MHVPLRFRMASLRLFSSHHRTANSSSPSNGIVCFSPSWKAFTPTNVPPPRAPAGENSPVPELAAVLATVLVMPSIRAKSTVAWSSKLRFRRLRQGGARGGAR